MILDIIMPEMNGYQVCRQIKSKPQTMNIPIVLPCYKGITCCMKGPIR